MMDKSGAGAHFDAGLVARGALVEDLEAPYIEYLVECFGPDGSLKWTETFRNLVTRAGAANLLDVGFGGSTQITTWYLGLIGNTSYTTGPAKTDTAASHSGWTEATGYSQANRPTIAWSAAGTGSDNVDKAASAAAAFSINATDTIKGAFLISNNTKGGTTGTLYSAGTFTDRAVVSGDTLNVTPTMRMTV